MSSPDPDLVNSLVKSVDDLDASRRVGWARAYDAAETRDRLEQQIALLRSELAQMRKHYSRLIGTAESAGGTSAAAAAKHHEAAQTWLDMGQWRLGAEDVAKIRRDRRSTTDARFEITVARASHRREIRELAYERGHTVHVHENDMGGLSWSCPCGATEVVTRRASRHGSKDAWRAAQNHLAVVVTGEPFFVDKRQKPPPPEQSSATPPRGSAA